MHLPSQPKTLNCLRMPLLAAAAWAAILPALPAAAQLSVFDPTNYSQNLLSAARALEQINNQVRSLQNEAAMLSNQAKNLSRINFEELGGLRAKLQEINRLMEKAKGIDFKVDTLDRHFRQLFPAEAGPARTAARRAEEARSRFEASMSAFRHTMGIQSQVVEDVREDAATLAAIAARSQGAEGALQAAQATNQLLVLAAKQQMQLQQLMAAHFRSEAVEQARRVQEAEEAKTVARRFLGQGKAYTPQ